MVVANNAWQEQRERRRVAVLEDEQVRRAAPVPDVLEELLRPGLALARIVAIAAERYGDRPALAHRATELVTDESGRTIRRLLPRYDTITYREMFERVRDLAAAWHHDAEKPVRSGDFACTIGFTSSDYAIVDLACTYLGLVSVPMQAGAAVAQWNSITAETRPRVIATSLEQLTSAVESIITGTAPERVLVFDYEPGDDTHRATLESARTRLREAGIAVLLETFGEALERGRTLPDAPLFEPESDDALRLLIYTSGSTGAPKGAIYTDRLAAAMWQFVVGNPVPSISFHYMPLSHVAGRLILGGTLARGGTAYFAAASDLSTIFDDFELVRPTELYFVPRVCEMLFQRFQSDVDRRVVAGEDRATAEAEVRADLRERVLGGRHLVALCASAPLSAEMRAFMESVLELQLHDGYGSTEAGAGLFVDDVVKRPPVLDYKLVDVPELGYFRSDKPHPRGELLVKTTQMFPGYYKRPEITAEMFDEDGFYRTGDVVAEVEPDRLVYVDRRNNVLKLSQGEFVTVAKLEAIFSTSPLIRQIYVYGSSERAFLLAVIVPTAEALALDPAKRKAAVGESLQRIAKEAELNSYEIPRDFLLETEPFTTANGLLSGIGKVLRPKLRDRYGERLERMYAELARERADELLALRRDAADRPVLETVSRAARALLGVAEAELSPDAHFAELGGDSLSALSLSNLLQEIFAVSVPVGVIVGPATDLRQLAAYIENERESGSARPSFASVHSGGTEIRAADLALDKFIDAETLSAAAGSTHAPQPPRTVLLTGANGYLGRFLALEWLRRLRDSDGTLICLVRGGTADAARQRLDAVFADDPDLTRDYRELSDSRLRVLAGDVAEPNLGLGEREWRRLAESVDLIVHPAALVNHVLPYDQLFGPNVVGTAEAIRLAITTRIKPITYLSTVSALAQIDPAVFDEDGDMRDMSPVRVLDDSYANGYGNSKWAGEVLLREAHDLCGLPVAVFRSDMILAHSRYSGQLNVPDIFTRLMLSLLMTGIAPKSFYQLDARGNRQRAHYEGLPADFTAEAIATLGGRVTAGYESFDVLNPHDDGISLDEFVDWLIEAGHPLERIDDFAEWFARFDTALRALPEQQRQHTVLPLLHAYRRPAPPTRGTAVPAKKFRAAVQQNGIGPDGDIPHLTRELIDKYVRDLRVRGLL
ncbi:carboxylic acid reductase [Nocardia terpenica]|uniref:Carboxylic acid reductase n=1 Tax=Nocardia terpenica TaxID=455432 RepID=A0A164L8S1_9NOCA|nr:carboxylic acid reductase [Nocardia terpenica]KZM72140.1 oxidoreductase [Nocardia terpenica]NQE86726.1 carboxylic acid reductase [Nocardia terpenica]